MTMYRRLPHLVEAMCPEPRRNQHQRGVSVRERTDDSCPSADLPNDPLERIVRAYLSPVRRRVRVVSQRLADLLFHQLRGGPELHLLQPCNHFGGLRLSGLATLLGVDRFEHPRDFGHFPVRSVAEHVAVEMNDAALPVGLRKDLCSSAAASMSPLHASEMIRRTPFKPRSLRCRRKPRQPSRSSFSPSATPRICRNPSVPTPIAMSTEMLRTSPAQLRLRITPSKYRCVSR